MARHATYIDGLMVVICLGDTDYKVSSDDSYLETDPLFVACTKTRGSVLFYPCYPCFFLLFLLQESSLRFFLASFLSFRSLWAWSTTSFRATFASVCEILADMTVHLVQDLYVSQLIHFNTTSWLKILSIIGTIF